MRKVNISQYLFDFFSASVSNFVRSDNIINCGWYVYTLAVLDNIIVARAYTHETQIQLLTMLAAKMSEEIFSLIVVDSATGTW
jgi:hypothetical protein